MGKIQELRQKRKSEIELIKDYYKDASRDKIALYLNKYILKTLDQNEGVKKAESFALEADLLKHVVAYNSKKNVEVERDAESVEYLLKYRELDYMETSLLLYSYIEIYQGAYSASLLLKDNKEVLNNLVKAYVKNELLSDDANSLYSERSMSLDTKNLLEQVEYSYSVQIENVLKTSEQEKEVSEKQLQLTLSM
jgi:hypothetical protein